MKQVRIYYQLDDGRRTTQTFTVPDDANTADLENVVKNYIKNVTTRVIVNAYAVDFAELNLE